MRNYLQYFIRKYKKIKFFPNLYLAVKMTFVFKKLL
jgi:hypothetical protein